MRSAPFVLVVLALSGVVLGAGCKKKAAPPPVVEAPPPPPAVAFHVTGIELGKTITADKAISAPTAVFGPKDTIFVSVATEGASSSAVLKARFTFGAGTLVNESSQTIAPTGPAHTEFHIVKPSGWPVGKYKVEITADSIAAGTKEFEVKKG
jgi:hypothetical protein